MGNKEKNTNRICDFILSLLLSSDHILTAVILLISMIFRLVVLELICYISSSSGPRVESWL